MTCAFSYKKPIAVLVIMAFALLLGGQAFPLTAQDAPGAVEKAAPAGAQPAHSSILPLLLIGVGVAAVAAVLIFVVFKTTYDITGTWTFILDYQSGASGWRYHVIFVGDKSSGTETNWGGTYKVDGKAVTCTLNLSTDVRLTFTGNFTDKDTMSGTFSGPGPNNGTWQAIRGIHL